MTPEKKKSPGSFMVGRERGRKGRMGGGHVGPLGTPLGVGMSYGRSRNNKKALLIENI